MKTEEQTIQDIKAFANKLSLINDKRFFSPYFGMLPLASMGADIALKRFITLNNKIFFAATTLVNSYKKEHLNLWGDDLESSLLIRSMYFEQSVETYNKVTDYIYQILYFSLHLYEKLDNEKIETQDDIITLSGNIKGKKLSEIDNYLIKEGNEYKNFSIAFKQYRSSCNNLREMANDIKHRGCLAIEGTTPPRWGKATKSINGKDINLTEIVEPITLDLNLEINKLVEVHKKTHAILQDLYKLCAFENTLKSFLDKNI